MTTAAQKIAALEAENSALRAKLLAAALPDVPPGVPHAAEAMSLFELVDAAYPHLKVPFAEFSTALYFAIHARRQPLPDPGYALSFWVDGCRAFLMRRGVTNRSVTQFAALFAAAIATGVPFSDPAKWPYCSLGFQLGDMGRPDEQWRSILEAGTLPPPTAPKRRPSTQVVQLNMLHRLDGGRPTDVW